jgi:hypothetical protein
MVEDQAVGRVLRLGQTKEVKVIRYIMKNTVEVVRQSCLKTISGRLMHLRACDLNRGGN